jgi:predicted DNA-binding transcriptional regulator AlpA
LYSFDTKEALLSYLKDNIINSAEAAEILGCSRQNIDDLVKRNKLKPIRVLPRDRLFLKKDVLARKL